MKIIYKDGTVADGVINAEILAQQFSAFELKVIGFTDEQKEKKLAIGAYVAVTDGEIVEYSYMQAESPGEGERYSFVSYNDLVGKKLKNYKKVVLNTAFLFYLLLIL